MTDNPEAPAVTKKPKKNSSWAATLAVVSIIVAIVAIVFAYFNWNNSVKANKLISANQNAQAASIENLVFSTKQQHTLLQDQAKQLQVLLERDTQKNKLDTAIVAAKQLVQLAYINIELQHDPEMALTLLKGAKLYLKDFYGRDVLAIKQSINNDILKLNAVPKINMPDLLQRLISIDNQVSTLKFNKPVFKTKPDDATAKETNNDKSGTWKDSWHKTVSKLKELVVIRKRTDKVAPLLTADDTAYLLLNLHTQIENARWAILNKNDVVYVQSLQLAQQWIRKYFVFKSPNAEAVLKELHALESYNVRPALPDISGTVHLLATAAKQYEVSDSSQQKADQNMSALEATPKTNTQSPANSGTINIPPSSKVPSLENTKEQHSQTQSRHRYVELNHGSATPDSSSSQSIG